MSPTLFNIYIYTFAEQLQKSTVPGVKCLMFADDLVPASFQRGFTTEPVHPPQVQSNTGANCKWKMVKNNIST